MKICRDRLKWWGIIPVLGLSIDELDNKPYNLTIMSYRLFKFEFPKLARFFSDLRINDDDFVYIVSDESIRTIGIR